MTVIDGFRPQHADKRIPAALVAAFLLQTAGALFWAGSAAERIADLERTLHSDQAAIEKVAVLEEQVRGIRQSLDRIEFVACKELLHILDHPACRAATEAEIEKLFSKMGLPPEMQEPIKDGPAVNTDRTAIYQAVAVLFPYATRQLLLKPYKDGKINLADIIRMVDIPKKYVASVMHENWESLHSVLTNLKI